MQKFDYLFKDVFVIDGSGERGRFSDVLVSGDRISIIQRNISFPAEKMIIGKGRVLCPGFIDIHGHSDHYLIMGPKATSKLAQGVTTEVTGNCGYSPFLLKKHFRHQFSKELSSYRIQNHWHDLESFSECVRHSRPAINWLTLVGHGTLRNACMGYQNRTPSLDEMKWMKRELCLAMEQGAFGLSSGLIYTPGCFAKTAELINLAKTISPYGGFYATHMRSEGIKLIESIKEALKISQKASVPLQISHLKTAGEKNWSKIDAVFSLIEDSVRSGLDVQWDRYPYTASYTSLDTCLPRHLFEGGDLKAVEKLKNPRLKNIYIDQINNLGPRFGKTLLAGLSLKKNQHWLGQSLNECSKQSRRSLGEFVIDLLIEEEMQVYAIFFSMSSKNLERILMHPKAMIGSDSSARCSAGKTFSAFVHPRTYGTFPKFIKDFVIQSRKITLEEGIRKMTGLPSERLGLIERGFLREGFFADLVLFDPQKITDQATFQNPTLSPLGIDMVFVNGKPVIIDGKQTIHRPGRFLRRGEE